MLFPPSAQNILPAILPAPPRPSERHPKQPRLNSTTCPSEACSLESLLTNLLITVPSLSDGQLQEAGAVSALFLDSGASGLRTVSSTQ